MAMKWTNKLQRAALREGWALFNEQSEVQRDDEGDLPDDTSAWALVILGNEPHHVVARTLVRERNPKHFAEMLRAVAEMADGEAAADDATERVEVLYEVQATAMLSVGAYDGPMTEESWRQHMVSNPHAFRLKWSMVEITVDGEVIACNGQEGV